MSDVALVALVALFGVLAVCFMVFCITILILFGGIFIFYYGKSDIKNKIPDCNCESFEKICQIVFNLFCFKSKPNEESPIKKSKEVPIKKSKEVQNNENQNIEKLVNNIWNSIDSGEENVPPIPEPEHYER